MTRLILPDQDTEQLASCIYHIRRDAGYYDEVCLYTEGFCVGNLSCRPRDCPLVEVKDEK